MILQSLVNCYEKLVKLGKVAALGWSPVKVSYALELNDDGEIINIISLKNPDKSGKKMIPQEMSLPTNVKRTVGIAANFLCDNSAYMLAADAKGKPERALACFRAAAELHKSLLAECEEPAAKAVIRFFESWTAEKLEQRVSDGEQMKDILGGANLIFMYRDVYLHKDVYLHENDSIRQLWQEHYSSSAGEKRACLVTGKMDVPAKLHPNIKGVMGAQSSGASLVSFNAPAFCSYGHEQGFNAPTSEYAAFAYGTALNYLISTQHTRIGDTTVLFWAETAEEQYPAIMSFCCWGNTSERYRKADLEKAVEDICKGKSVNFDNAKLNPETQFYILGISPNAARLSVRFFLRNTFGEFIKNIQGHQKRLEIVHPKYDKFETIPLWKLLNETVNQDSKDKTPAPNLAGEMLRAILNNTPYPATLLNGVQIRIRADHEINRVRAAIIKAYYLKRKNPDVPEEVLQMSLNQECNDTAYVLGRLFAELEHIQYEANGDLNTTIRDKYFNSASATPAVVFPTLVNLAQKHLRKIGGGLEINLNKQLTKLMDKLGESYPAHLSLPQQGSFQLGYYHQTAFIYMNNKEDK